MPMEGPKPGNCCRSNTDGTKTCPRYWVCWVPPGCDPSYIWLEPGVAMSFIGDVGGDPRRLLWYFQHVDIVPAIFNYAYLWKDRTDTGGFWKGRVRAALLSALEKDKLQDINSPMPEVIDFLFPLIPVFGPEDPDFLPQGIRYTGFKSRSGILADFPDCDLRMLPV